MTTYDDAKAALAELLKGGEAFKITPQLLRDALIALAEGIRLVEEDAGTASATLAAHLNASDPHSQYTTTAEAEAIATTKANDVKAQLLGGEVTSALDTLLEVAARFQTDESTLTSLVASIAGKQAASDALTQIAGLARTKGSLIVGTATAWSLLGASTDDYVLTLDASQPGGVKWASAGGYSLPVATNAVLGGVKPSTGLAVDGAGVLTLSVPNVTFNTGSIIGRFTAAAVTDVPLVARGAAGQTANLGEWQDSSGGLLASIGSDGTARFGRKVGVGIGYAPNAWLEIADPLTNNPTQQFSYSGAPSTYNNIWTATGWGESTQTLTLTMKLGATTNSVIRFYQSGIVEIPGTLKFGDGTTQTTASGITRAESSQLTMPSGGGWTTFAHGLGVTPKRWGAYAICITATTDFAVGDMISFDTDHGYSTLTTVAANATSVKFGLNNGYLYGGPAWGNLLNANFKLVLWAEK